MKIYKYHINMTKFILKFCMYTFTFLGWEETVQSAYFKLYGLFFFFAYNSTKLILVTCTAFPLKEKMSKMIKVQEFIEELMRIFELSSSITWIMMS